jgi:hypothetical protein
LRISGIGFLRSRYFVEDLEKRGHTVKLANFIAEDSTIYESKLQNDLISFKEVSEFDPDVLLIELGAFSTGNRIPGRQWLNELKLKGCIIVHCGLDYNEYNGRRKQYDEMFAGFGLGIVKKEGDSQDRDELPNIRGSDHGQIAVTDVEVLRKYCSIQDPIIFKDVLWIESHHALVIRVNFNEILLTAGHNSFVKAYNDWDLHGERDAVYGAFNDSDGIEILITGHFVTDGKERVEGEYNRTFLINALEYLHIHHPLTYRKGSKETNRTIEEQKTYTQQSEPAVETNTSKQPHLAELRQLLVQHFDQDELKTICFDLSVDYDALQGEGKNAKAREFILHMKNHGRIHELENEVIKQRPDISWPNS